jgi:superfamily II DNA or RNA helicase
MLKLEEIHQNLAVSGIESSQVVRIVTTEPAGENALTVYYKTPDGRILERMLFRADEEKLAMAEVGRPWAFDASGADFKLATEAYRINLAYLFDPMMAIHTSDVEPLPHQITAVYESMLPRQPLRYILADDPGAGKTIMAGLFIRELLMRADARRVLVVAPGSLVEQWQDEMFSKFGLRFEIFSWEMANQAHGNPFEEADLMIARMDQLSRNDDLKAKLALSRWDLIVVDEAHKLSASYYGLKINKTQRFQLGELLGTLTRHFLLMTATPHNGKEDDFQLFLSLLDADRFYGKNREDGQKPDVSDLMRRMIKEDLLKFDGTRLFPERKAYTTKYQLSDAENDLYSAVTDYVKRGMNRADQLDSKRRGTVSFALMVLQRRLASSPEAIYRSLKRRHDKLTKRLEEEKQRPRVALSQEPVLDAEVPENIDDLSDEMEAGRFEELEESIVDQATAAQTIPELEEEIATLENLEEQARQVLHSGKDRKWEELSQLLQNTPEMRDPTGRMRKLIVFTEHRDTLNYLKDRICGLIGNPDAVVTIHGGLQRDERRKIQESFCFEPDVRILVATDAAGEGINLQQANLLINYDLPWNPNRIEQRFGRIHRIGQTEVCHMWNMVAIGTREGEVFTKLFEKLEIERTDLGGRVFDILGDVFEERSLRDLLIDAIRYGEDPARKQETLRVVEGALDREKLKSIMERNVLCEEIMDAKRVFAVKEEMEKAEARKLQPHFIRAFFEQAFGKMGGELRPRENGRFQIPHVPAIVRERDRKLGIQNPRHLYPVVKSYERVCFEKSCVRIDRPGAPMASLIHPGHPLMQALIDIVLEQNRNTLKQGAVFFDPNDPGITPKVFFILDHSIKEGANPDRIVSRRMQFISVYPDTSHPNGFHIENAGWAPHLDMEPISPDDARLVQDALKAGWIGGDLEQLALTYASEHIVPEHFKEVEDRRKQQVEKTLNAVHERLVREINYWSGRYIKFQEDQAAGKDVRLNLENVRRTIDELSVRRESREKELNDLRNVISATPVIVGGALVIPAGMLARARGEPGWTADAEARARIEKAAIQAVMEAERRMGHVVDDVSAQKCGWDVTSLPQMREGTLPPSRHIEVKGRAKGTTTVTVTRNEILYALNQADKFLLAIVLIDGNKCDKLFYIRRPFDQEPGWAVTSVNYDLPELEKRGLTPEQSE